MNFRRNVGFGGGVLEFGKTGMLDKRDDGPWSARQATGPPTALVIDGRGSTGVTSYNRGRQRAHHN